MHDNCHLLFVTAYTGGPDSVPVEMEDIGILCNYISEILNKLDAKKPDRSDLFGGRKRLDLTNPKK
ncbi:hypothetical protein J21TS3_30420 [Paenibacillus cookii]|uniref:Uncharacterized protein n=1 Tax=Paenibacillus cookii TaxID=157839 RepID=A0ABQ4LZR5_9BACL|nr:hypothetical protein J21TS3_30420 [Paenibacillus cookii]